MEGRKIAFEILKKFYQKRNNLFAEEVIEDYFKHNKIDFREKNLAYKISCGVIENELLLDFYIQKISDRKIRDIEQGIVVILRIALYQMLFLDKIPEYACVDEAVELVKKTVREKSAGFVNAVLRKFLREKENIIVKNFPNTYEGLSLRFSCPIFLTTYFVKNFGVEKTIDLLEYFKLPAPLYIRVNDKPAVIEELKKLDIPYFVLEDNILRIKNTEDVFNLESFQKGLFYVQDIHALEAVKVLNPKPGEIILDACAAPGGKTSYIAELTGEPKNITALDISPDRILTLKENFKRLNISGINVVCEDIRKINWQDKKFDKILLDAPCSNLGVIGRKLDVKYRITQEEIFKFSNLQTELLESLYGLMKQGSVLVYSTCTLAFEENQDVVRKFLKRHKDLKIVYENLNLPSTETGDGGYVAGITFLQGKE